MKYICILFLFWFSVTASASDEYPFALEKQEAQFTHLLKELRCLVCQNQDLMDSNAPLAKDLKQAVYQRVNQGESDEAIIRYLNARYGDFILFNPPVKRITYLLWGAPVIFLSLGFLLFWRTYKKQQQRQVQHG